MNEGNENIKYLGGSAINRKSFLKDVAIVASTRKSECIEIQELTQKAECRVSRIAISIEGG